MSHCDIILHFLMSNPVSSGLRLLLVSITIDNCVACFIPDGA